MSDYKYCCVFGGVGGQPNYMMSDKEKLFNLKSRKEMKSDHDLSNLQGTIKQPDIQVFGLRKKKESIDQVILLMK